MLDAFIIEEIKRREKAREQGEQRREELPLPDEPMRKTDKEKENSQRGVVVIDVSP